MIIEEMLTPERVRHYSDKNMRILQVETGIVNEPLMKIGDHADTVDNTQTSVQIPTFAGTTVIDYDGTTKPSQMYTEYNSQSRWEDIDNYKMANENWTPEVTE